MDEVAVRSLNRAVKSRVVGVARENRGHDSDRLSAIKGIEYRGITVLGSSTPRRLSRYCMFANVV